MDLGTVGLEYGRLRKGTVGFLDDLRRGERERLR